MSQEQRSCQGHVLTKSSPFSTFCSVIFGGGGGRGGGW